MDLRRRRFAAIGSVVVAIGLVIVGASGCSSGGSSAPTSTSTTESPSVVTALPPLPSTIAPSTSVCGTLRDLYGFDDLELHSGNWTLERQRVVTDARREAGLLRQAADTIPELRAALVAMATYADAVAEAVTAGGSYDAAVSAVRGIDGTAAKTSERMVAAWAQQHSC